MLNATKTRVLVLTIFTFAFAYRLGLMLWQTYPPGADIGFHASVINSITQSGNTNFLWNPYQMGGEIELEFPGYHIFTSEIIFLTGLPNYVAQGLVAAFFSSLTVLAIFLVTRITWNEIAAVFAAFFVAVSPADIEIISWGGYPNIVVLFLIPLTFYLFFKREKIAKTPYLISTSLLAVSIFLTHSLSAAIFLGITTLTLFALLIFPRVFGKSRKTVFYWALPIVIGAVLVSPFLIGAIPIYLNGSAILTGSSAIGQALLAYRMFPLEIVLTLSGGIAVFFVLSKRIKGRFFSLPVFLQIIWLLVPLLLTQGYLVGLYVDAVRFSNFFIYPAIILLAVIIDSSARLLSDFAVSFRKVSRAEKVKIARSFRWLNAKISATIRFKHAYATFVLVIMLILLFVFPIFRLPWEGVKVQQFYQVMDNTGYQGIEWAKQNTPSNAVFVSDLSYGWWLAGFAQRPTISSVDLQALSLASEVNIAQNASYMLDTDYVIDNGYLQIREDGGYLARHNPLITASSSWVYEHHPSIGFNSDKIILLYCNGHSNQSISLSQLPVTDMQLINSQTPHPAIVINKANSDINCTEILTLSEGLKFANMTYVVRSSSTVVSLSSLSFLVDTWGTFQQGESGLTVLDESDNACTQMFFVESQPKVELIQVHDSCLAELTYAPQGNTIGIQILAGIYKLSADNVTYDAQSAQTASESLPITTFDYKTAMQQYNISYVANRNFALNPKFSADPKFTLAFSNDEVVIFKVAK